MEYTMDFKTAVKICKQIKKETKKECPVDCPYKKDCQKINGCKTTKK
jgi:hypothetical protein